MQLQPNEQQLRPEVAPRSLLQSTRRRHFGLAFWDVARHLLPSRWPDGPVRTMGDDASSDVPFPERADSPSRRSAGLHLAPKKLLVVEDEEVVRDLLVHMLSQLGYHVTTCADGVEAVDYYKGHHANVDAVLLDLVMPRMNGEETLREFNKIRGDVPVLIVSGYAHQGLLSETTFRNIRGTLAKPFSLSDLAKAVASTLGAEGAGGKLVP